MRIIRIDNKGWRARFDDGFDEDNVSRVADAFGFIWADATPGATIYVGYDTRLLGRRLAGVVAGVLASYGLKVKVSDTYCPTPAVGFAVASDAHAQGAVMLTASGAAAEIGGICTRAADGGPIPDEFYDAAKRIMMSTPQRARGSFAYVDIMGPYLEALRASVDSGVIAAAGLSVVVDPLYGAARGHLASLLRSVGCRVHEVHGEEHTDFDGLRPIPEKPWVDTCEHAVVSYGCDLGIVCDGDADRVGIVDERGHFVTPHRVGPIVIGHLAGHKGMDGRVVTTYSSSALVRRQAARYGLDFTAVPMGFGRIYREFVEGDVVVGLEEMGGICVPEHLSERDALLAALLFVEARAVAGTAVTQMVGELESEIGSMTYVKRDVSLDVSLIQAFRNILPGINLREVCGMRPISVGHSDGLVLRFEDDSWVQLRPSRTESLVRVRAESPDPELAEALAGEACESALSRLRSLGG